jgi:hypothetical protein
MKLSAPYSAEHAPSSGPLDRTATEGPPAGGLNAALERQRWQEDFDHTVEAHAGALDLERLVETLPGGRSPVGQALRRDLRRNGRYVRLNRPLGHAALTWDARFSPGPDPRRSRAARLLTALGWLERLSGVRLPAGRQNEQPLTLGPGEVTLLLPVASPRPTGGAGLLLAEREGQVFQYLPVPDGRWQLLESVSDLQTEPVAQVDEGRLGLERLPQLWSTLSSARRQERARRLRVLSLLLVLALFVVIGRLLTHGGLWLLIGPALVLTILLAVTVERRFALWVRLGPALSRGAGGSSVSGLLFPASGESEAAPVSPNGWSANERPFPLAQYERLLSAETRTRLAALRAELSTAHATLGAIPTDSLTSDLNGLLEDRFSYPHSDPALDALLDGQMATLQTRMNERLDLERQRARELAAQRLRRETVDSHF